MITNLASLLAPASTSDLQSAIASRQRLFVRTGDGARFAGLLPWETVNLLFTVNRFAPGQIRVLRASMPVRASMYEDSSDASRLQLDALQALAEQGVSLVINGINKLVPDISALTAMIQRHLRGVVWANAYFSFRQQGAFLPHWDAHDVLVLHVSGRKRWRCYGSPRTFPVTGFTFGRGADAGPVQWEEVLEPGDVLFLPRGEVHAAAVEPGEASLHLSVGIQSPRGADVLKWMSEGAADVLRRDVGTPLDADALRRQEGELKAALHRLIDDLELEAFHAHMDRVREYRPASNFGASAAFTPATWLRSALGRRMAIPPAEGGVAAFHAGGHDFRLTPLSSLLLALLQERDALTVSQALDALAGASFDEVVGAAGELAQKGLIHVGPDAASPGA